VDFYVGSFWTTIWWVQNTCGQTNDIIVNTHNVNTKYEFLCDVEIIMGLTCVLIMLEAMQSLRKYAWNMDTFICDYVTTLKIC
jgi:hypothetical protein